MIELTEKMKNAICERIDEKEQESGSVINDSDEVTVSGFIIAFKYDGHRWFDAVDFDNDCGQTGGSMCDESITFEVTDIYSEVSAELAELQLRTYEKLN